MSVDLLGHPDGPGHHAEASSTPNETGLVDQIFFGENPAKTAEPNQRRSGMSTPPMANQTKRVA